MAAARIQRQQRESDKFVAEQRKLMSEGRKFDLDPWMLVLGALGAILAGFVARLPEILHAVGVGR